MKTWKIINNFKNVENDMYEISKFGEVREKKTKKILHKKVAQKKNHPYYAVYLKKQNGKSDWVLVHQLVATFFVKIPKEIKESGKELVPDHLDNNGLNNNYNNLEWKTRGGNVKSAHEKGFISNKCDNSPHALISNSEAREICTYLEKGLTYNEILDKMNFPNQKKYRALLVRIKNRNAWNDISKDFNFNSSKTKYTKSQLETLEHLPQIKSMIEQGYSNIEIIRAVWGSDCDKIKSKDITVRNIRQNKIFKDII